MITDEQIARIFNKHGANFFAGARELIALAQQEPAQAVPAFWASENILKESLRDNISCVLTTTKCAANTVPLYATPAPLDSDTRKMVLELCAQVIRNSGEYEHIPGTVEAMAADIIERLEAGE